jgi:hypothetical protein
LVPFDEQSPGGGAGGGSVVTPPLEGGAGGASGGVIRLSAGRIVGAFGISAIGTPGENTGCMSGGGGGGAGGGIHIRATVGFEFEVLDGVTADLVASAGEGGNSRSEIVGCRVGGRGGDGVIRVDAPLIDLGLRLDPPAVRGPVFVTPDAIVRDAQPLVSVIVAPGEYEVTVNGEPDDPLLSIGLGQFGPRLTPGSNEICVHVEDDLFRECKTLVYVP